MGKILETVTIDESLRAAYRQIAFNTNLSRNNIMVAALKRAIHEWNTNPKTMAADLQEHLVSSVSVVPSKKYLGDKVTNWRARRWIAYEAADQLRSVIEHLGEEDGAVCAPVDSKPTVPTPAIQNEMENLLTGLLRLILLHNDGNVSPDSLQRF